MSEDNDWSNKPRSVEEQNEVIIILLKTIRDHLAVITKILAGAAGAAIVYALDRAWRTLF